MRYSVIVPLTNAVADPGPSASQEARRVEELPPIWKIVSVVTLVLYNGSNVYWVG